jgi:hypothetical protein
LFPVLGDRVYRQRHRGVVHVRDRVHALAIEPLADDGGSHVRFILMVAYQDLDPEALGTKVLDRLSGTSDRGWAVPIAIIAGQIVHDPDADGLRDSLGPRLPKRHRYCKRALQKIATRDLLGMFIPLREPTLET